MLQQETDDNLTAHEMAIQLKHEIKTTLAELGIDSNINSDSKNDLLQVTADDFDAVDHLNQVNRKHNSASNSKEDSDELTT